MRRVGEGRRGRGIPALALLGGIVLAAAGGENALAGDDALPPPVVRAAPSPDAPAPPPPAPSLPPRDRLRSPPPPPIPPRPTASAPRRVSTAAPVAARPPATAGVARRTRDPATIARGPVEVRDFFLLAQPRLTLPAVSPDPLRRGEWRVRVGHDWGNDFGFSQLGGAESPLADRRFLVDGEHRTIEVAVRYGLRADLDVGVRIPVHWRGGGFLDGFIDWWHERGGFADNARGEFLRDRFRVQGRDAAGQRFSWDDEKGLGLGNVELEGHWAFLRAARREDWRAALVARLGLPTGTGPYETGSVEGGLQLAAAKQLARRFDLYGGVGGTVFSEDTIDGIVYEPFRGHGFLALEYRPFSYGSLLLQTDVSSRLIRNLVDYPGVQWYLHVGAVFDLSPRVRLYFGLTENLLDQQSTVDVGVWGGLTFHL